MASELLKVIENVARKKLINPETEEERPYYFGTITSDVVKDVTFVPVNEQSPRTYLHEEVEDGYQRYASTSRMGEFSKFLLEHPLSVVPPVVLSGRNLWKFTPYEGHADVGKLEVYGSAVIIDGQHRVGGYVRLYELHNEARPIDFVLLPDLQLKEEVRQFVTINNTQKGVARALTAYLQIELGEDEDAWVAWELNQREESPFKGKITKQKMQKQYLFGLHSIAKNVGRSFNRGGLKELDKEAKVNALIRYWRLIADNHPDEWEDMHRDKGNMECKLLELTGFIAWSLVAKEILGGSFDAETEQFSWDRVEALIKRAAARRVDWRKDGEYEGLTGEVGGARIKKDIEQLIGGAT